MIVINRFLCGALMASVVFFPNYSFSQEGGAEPAPAGAELAPAAGEIFEVNAGTDEQNGGDGNVLDGGDTLLVTDDGSIDIITNQPAAAVRVFSEANNVVENDGRVSLTRLEGIGMVTLIEITSESTDTVVENSGRMELTSGPDPDPEAVVDDISGIGIRSVGATGDVTVINSENGQMIISTQGDGVAMGIEYKGSGDLIFTNAGTLSVKGSEGKAARALLFSGKNLDVDISGTATMEMSGSRGQVGFAVINSGINNEDSPSHRNIDISGSVILRAANLPVYGVWNEAPNVTINISGSFIATSSGDYPVYIITSRSHSAAITNSGIISATTAGIGRVNNISFIHGGSLVNSGTITSSGNGDVYGVEFNNGGSLVNSGTITASGIKVVNAVNFASLGGGGSLVNSGTITALGTIERDQPDLSYAVGGSGAITISNSGSIIGSVKNNIPAIYLIDGAFLEFGKGSFIVGEILLGGDTSISIDGDQANSLHYVFGGDGEIVVDKPQVSGPSPVFYSADGKEVAILDTSNLNAGIDALEAMTGNISGLIRSRRFVQDGSRSHVWVSGALSRRANGKSVSFFTANDEIKDFSVGVDGVFFPRLSVGGLVGANMSSMVTSGGNNMPGSYQGESMGMFGAVYAIQRVDRVFLQTAVSGGFLKHNDKRFIQDNTVDNGIDIARSSYHSYWYSPEVTLGVGISASDWTYTPSVNFRYARQWVDAYGEEGSKSNVTYDRYSISLLSGRAGLAADRQFSSAHLTLRTGFQSFGLIGGRNDVSLSMLDSPEQIFVIHSGSKRGIYGGVDVVMQLSQNASIILGGEAIFSKDKKVNTHLSAGLDIAF